MTPFEAQLPATLSGRQIQTVDWNRTPLGPPAGWSSALTSIVSMMLACPTPMFLAWGPDLNAFYNDAYVPILGRRAAGAMGMPFRQLWGDIWDDIGPLVDATLAGGHRRMVDMQLDLQREGVPEESWWTFTYSPVFDDDGVIAGMLCVTGETTQRIVAERARAAADERLQLALSVGNGIGVWDWDITANRVTADERFARLYGLNPGEVVAGAPIEAFFAGIHPEDLPDVRRAIEAAIADGGGFASEYRVVGAGGRSRWVSAQGRCIVDEQGRPTRFPGVSYDITERKLAETALQTAERDLAAIFARAPVGLSELTLDGRFVRVNDELCRMLGRSRETLLSQDFAAVTHPDDIALSQDRFRAAIGTGASVAFDKRYVGADGQPLWASSSLTPLKDDRGAPRSMLAVTVDLTDRHAAIEALRASEEFNRRVLGASTDCIKVLDLDGRIEFVSESGVSALEIDDLDAVIGRAWPSLYPEEERGKAVAALAEARRGSTGRFHGFCATMRGNPRWWDVAVTAINGADGRPDKVLIVSRDVTERERAAADLRDLNQSLEQQVAERTAELHRYRDIIEATVSPICAFDTDYRLIAFNRAHNDEFRRVNGFDTRIGDVFPDQFFPEQRPIIRGFMARALAGERFTVVEAFGRPEYGVPSWEITYTPLRDEAGRIIGAFHEATDISDRLAAEAELEVAQEALRQSQKMEAMGQLTGGVAHDFNNLLTPIIGSLDMLVRKGVGSERERRLIDGALQSAERAKTLVQRLLAFARRQPLQPTAVDVSRLVGGMVDLIGSTLGPTIDVRVDLAADLPPASADPNQLEMALLNLAVNARDAMPDGGELIISAGRDSMRQRHASGLRPGHYVRLGVRDTGIGMDEAVIRRATEPFFSTKGIGKGTGLGLSMVHGLAAQLGGGLTIDSAPGQGTTIELWLPISAVALEDGAAQIDPTPLAPRLGTALLVDDEELVRMSTAHMLADLGYEVVEAGSGEDAIRMVREGLGFDLLVTDHLMPGMNGTQLARALRVDRPGLPVLVVSGYAETDGLDADLARLTKPFRNAELAASLSALLAASET